MERLTARHKNGNKEAYYPYCFRPDTCDGDGTSEKCNRCHFEKAVCERLANYEETGLTPEQIRVLKERDTAKEPEKIIKIYNDIKVKSYICPACKEWISDKVILGKVDYRPTFCSDCGQRLKWEKNDG